MPKTVMISSTAIDLPEHRKQAIEACQRLGFIPNAMEHLPARDADAMRVSLEMVEQSDIYLGIYAWRYGYVPEGHDISVTEMEYDRAVERGIPILVFTIHKDHPLLIEMVETRPGAQEKLAALKEKACKNRGRAEFRSPEDLRAHILHALTDLKERQRAGQPTAIAFHPPSHIPTAPEPYIAHPYTLLHSKDLIGRQAELNQLTHWITARPEVRLFHVVALGGMGKSALTWKWFNQIAPLEMPKLAGRLWWSFYESDAHYENFTIRALAYVAAISETEARKLPINEREDRLFGLLNSQPFLLVLDGLERILLAYARMDAAYLPDDALDEQTAHAIATHYGLPDHIKETYLQKHRLRLCADPRAGRFLLRLTQLRTSRVLISTRLYPAELQLPNAQPLPGCLAMFLSGLSDDDALNLWREFGISGSREELLPVFKAFGNYPLLLRALAGEVAEYRPAPGDFARWRKANPGFNPAAELDLRNAKTHVLHYALQGLSDAQRQVLHTLAGFRMPSGWETVRDLWLADAPPAVIPAGNAGIQSPGSETTRDNADGSKPSGVGELPSVALGSGIPCRNDASELRGEHALDRILTELEDRGLVAWDRQANRYDLHPIVRGVVWASLSANAQQDIYRQLHNYFDAAPRPPEWDKVESLEDLTPAIELYHSLIGLQRYDDAFAVFQHHLEYATLWRLSASRQRAEWLEKLFPNGRQALPSLTGARQQSFTLNALGQAYQFSGEPGRAGLTSVGFSPYAPSVQIAKVGPLISVKLGHPSGRPGLTGRS
jgi:hypothetical protein